MYKIAGDTFYDSTDLDLSEEITRKALKYGILGHEVDPTPELTDAEISDIAANIVNEQSIGFLSSMVNTITTDILSKRYEKHWLTMLSSLTFDASIYRLCCARDLPNLTFIHNLSRKSKKSLIRLMDVKFLYINTISRIKLDKYSPATFCIFDEAADALVNTFPLSFRHGNRIYIRYAPYEDSRCIYRLNRYLHYLL